MEKTYISGDTLLLDSFRLAAMIYRSGLRPDLIVGIWRGGTPIAIVVQEYFEYMGHGTDHIAVRATSYRGIAEQDPRVRIDGLDYIINNDRGHQDLLIVDDVFDTGRSVEALFRQITAAAGDSSPATIRTAMPWYKPANNLTDRQPDYYLYETDRWLVFPHEICGLTREEIERHKGRIAGTLPPA